MKNKRKIVSVFLVLFMLCFANIANASTIEKGNSLSTQQNNISVPDLSTLEKFEPGKKYSIGVNESKLFKYEANGKVSIIEIKGILEKSTINTSSNNQNTSAASAVTAASTQQATYTQVFNFYSNLGVLQGTCTMKQIWKYNNGIMEYLPNATLTPYVPLYSWPNYWTDKVVNSPVYDSSLVEYVSNGEYTLKLCTTYGGTTIPFETVNVDIAIHFNAWGGAYGTSSYIVTFP